MSRRITPQTTIENLRQEAKRWLRALRGGVREAHERFERALLDAPRVPTLRDVQHALAREYGLPGWADLKHLVSPRDPAGPTIARYEQQAVNLLEAYRTGTPAAMERHWNDTWHRRAWDGMRRYVLLDLGRQPDAEGSDADISPEDARYLVAREHGFESWPALVGFLATISPGTRLAETPVLPYAPHADDSEPDGDDTRDWDHALAQMKDRQLEGLDARGQVTDAVLDRISHLEHITTLRLGSSKLLTDAGLRHVARLPRLRQLDLSNTRITDRGLAALRDHPALESIGLAWTPVTDAGVACLSGAPRLQRVDLSGTPTGDGAIRSLAGKPALRHFRSGGRVTDAGIPFLHEFPVFRTWQGGQTSMALLSPDVEPNSLALRGSFTDRGLASLAGLDGLFALNVDDRRLPITARGLKPLISLPNLGFLAVDATDETMPYIAAMPRLQFFICQDTVAGDDGFAALSRSDSIAYLWGRRCHHLGSRGFRALARMPALGALAVSCKNVDDAALSALPDFPALRELMPMDVPDAGYRHIGRCDGLESLVLMYCRESTDAATEHLVQLKRLRQYFASYNQITDRTPRLLGSVASLEQVEFSACAGLTNDGVAALARLPRLRELRVSGSPKVTRDVSAAFPRSVRVRYAI